MAPVFLVRLDVSASHHLANVVGKRNSGELCLVADDDSFLLAA